MMGNEQINNELIEKLRKHIEEIIQLTDDDFLFIYSLFSTKTFKKTDYIIREGELVIYNYFVVAGLLKLTYTDDSGKQQIVSFAMENWWETDFPAYYKQTKATMSLQCIEDTIVLCLTLENYHRLCLEVQKMEGFFLQKANFGYIALQARLLFLLTTNAKERYEKLLQQYPTLFQRVSHTLIASYLGVSRETLSRLYSKKL